MEAPVKWAVRFRTPKQQRRPWGLQAGSVDIVVGTHRLLSKDVRFHDLGLVIIEEEQRFGQHKENSRSFIGVVLLPLPPPSPHPDMSGIGHTSTIEQLPAAGGFPCWSRTT